MSLEIRKLNESISVTSQITADDIVEIMDYDFSSTNSMDLVDRRQSRFSSDSAHLTTSYLKTFIIRLCQIAKLSLLGNL
jgi:protein tyrosine phosphatase (PTP) superfamily phosphohydrolase (DUF442 family)